MTPWVRHSDEASRSNAGFVVGLLLPKAMRQTNLHRLLFVALADTDEVSAKPVLDRTPTSAWRLIGPLTHIRWERGSRACYIDPPKNLFFGKC